MAAIAAAAVLTTGHVNVTESGGLVITGKILNHRATPAVLDAAIHNASFRAVLPDGLPAGTGMRSVLTAGSDVIALEYDLPGAWRRTDHVLYVILANPAAVNGKFRPPNMQLQLRAPHPRIASWRIGAEQIYISSDSLTPIELARIKAAMQKEAGQ